VNGPRGRFGQLTYSSFDRGQGAGGGWQVKQTSGGLTEEEQEFLRSRVATQFDSAVALPQFPTPEEIAGLPRRLLYVPRTDGTAAYWHTVPAGLDGSGRPGNVFAHVVLDRDVTPARPGLRPIELWRSPDWLAPYGSQEVLTATLRGGELPRAGVVLDRAAVLDFLLDPQHWRIGVLSGLLDAVDAALRDGPPVVLMVDSADEGARWIGAVSELMSAGTARTFGWSTYERAGGLAGLWRRGVALAAVPREDRSEIDADTVLMIDPEQALALGDLGGEPHRTQAGVGITVTPWSVIAQVVVADRARAERALDAQDTVAAQLGDRGLRPALPLALAVGMLLEVLGDAVNEAAQVLTECAPAGLSAHPALFATAGTLLRRSVGTSTAAAWEAVRALNGGGRAMAQELALHVYAERVLHDPYWHRRPDGIPFPAGLRPTAAPGPELVVAAEQLVATVVAAADSLPSTVHAVRVIDFVVQMHLVQPAQDSSTVALLNEALDRMVIARLRDPASAMELINALDSVSETLQSGFLRPLLARTPEVSQRPLGQRVPSTVLYWMFPEASAIPSIQTLLGNPEQVDPLVSELAVQVSLFGDPYHPTALALRHVALWALLYAVERDPTPLGDPAPLFVGGPWAVRDLHALLARFGSRVPGRFLAATLAAAPYDAELDALIGLLLSASGRSLPQISWSEQGDYAADAVMRLRRLAISEWWRESPHVAGATVTRILSCLAEATRYLPAKLLAADLYPTVLAAYVIDVALHPDGDTSRGIDELLDRVLHSPGASERALGIVTAAVDSGLLTDARMVFAAISSAPQAPVDLQVSKRVRTLGAVRVVGPALGSANPAAPAEATVPMLEAILRSRAGSGQLGNPGELAETVLDMHSDSIPEAVSDAEFNRRMAPFEKFAKQWWLSIGVPAGGVFGGRFRRG